MDAAITIPTYVNTKQEFDKWLEKDVGDKLTSVQKDALKSDISAKLGLDLGNAITAYGRAAINADLEYFFKNPTATNIPKLESELKPDAKGPHQFDELRGRANQFSDPFLIDLTAVLALMHETSEKLRSATKELRQAEHSNAQMQMQAAAEDIKAQGTFQAVSGALSAGMSIASGASGLKAAGGGLKSLHSLQQQAKLGLDDGMPKMPKLDDVLPKDLSTGKTQSKPGSKDFNEVSDLQKMVQKDLPTIEKNLAKLDPNQKTTIKSDLDDLKKSLDTPKSDGPQKLTKAEFDTKVQEISLISQKWQAYGQMLDGVGKALGGSFGGMATQFEAAKALHDKEAADAQFQKEQTADLVKTLSDFSQQIRQTVQAILSSQEQAAHRVANV